MRRSPLRPIGFEQLQLLTRKEQLAVTFTALNFVYKLMVVHASLRVYKVRRPETERRHASSVPPLHAPHAR